MLLGVLALLAVAGCGGSSSTTPAPSRLPLSAVIPNGLTAKLSQSTSVVAAGGSVTYTLTLANHTAQPITYQQQLFCGIDGEGAALHVTDAAGNPVYPAPGTDTCASIGYSSPLTLAPGQSSSFTVPSPVTLPAAGRYSAIAFFSVGPVVNRDYPATYTPTPTTTVGPLEANAR